MNTKLDPFKYTNYLINNALSAKKAPNPYELFYSLKVGAYNSSQKSEVASKTMKLANGMLEDNYRMVSGIIYAFVARSCNSSRCASMATRILLLDERNMNPAYTHKIAKTLKGYYKTRNSNMYNLMKVYEMRALSRIMQQRASLSKQYKNFNYFFYKDLSSDVQKMNYYG